MLLLITATGAVSAEGRESALRALYDAHDWSGPRAYLEEGEGPTFYQEVVAAAFNDARAEGLAPRRGFGEGGVRPTRGSPILTCARDATTG